MGILDWIWSLTGRRTDSDAAFVLHLNARSKGGLRKSLDRLAPSEQGYLTESEAADLFGFSGESLREFNAAAFTELGGFAAAHRCTSKRVRSEARVYFTKNPN